jgi:glucoamylase
VQQKPDGSFPQNSWLDGRPYWGSLQMDEVSFPIMLAYELGRTDGDTYWHHIKPAANFIVAHGPATPQERWEEESGYSPSTIAAEIAGLICAAQIARQNGDESSGQPWLQTADSWAQQLESWTVTTKGPYSARYFIRIAQHGRPNDGEKIELNNGAGTWDEREIVDAGFLELVRLGIRRPDDALFQQSLEVIDRIIKVQTPKGPDWYRYNHDGYGEKADGRGYDGTGIGRLWILLAGERGEYALAAGKDARPYLDAMQNMANQGRMLAEQVWDRPDSPDPAQLRFGEATGSATPLSWTNAQFVRLAIAIQEAHLPEIPQVVLQHFQPR